jgi:FkbH-like protein
MQAADFLFPSELTISKTTIKRVLLVGSCTAAQYHHYLIHNIDGLAADYVLTNNFMELPEELPAPASEYDFQVIQIPLREILTDQIINFSNFRRGDLQAAIDDIEQSLTMRLDAALKYARAHGILTFVSNFPVPQVPVVAALKDIGTNTDLRAIIRDLNAALTHAIAKHNNVFISDIESIASSMGKRYFQDDLMNFYSHGAHWYPADRDLDIAGPQDARIDPLPLISDVYESRAPEILDAIWRQWIYMYRILNQIDAVKMVIFDLDDTMWRGQIAEHYGDNVTRPVPHGWPTGLWEAIHHLRARGILTAICSKNEASLVEGRWDRAVYNTWLTLDDFVFKEINWQPKAANIAKIIGQASLTPKSVVFVDDNPVERESVRAALPGIRVIGDNPYLTRRILLWSSETQVARLTKESANRETMMRQQQKRESERASVSREDFLMGLKCRVQIDKIISIDDPQFGRSFELLNKTNQFNTTGTRWTGAEIFGFLTKGGCLYAVHVEDKFTKYGLVGVILYSHGHFHQFAMSCRVLGMDIETSVVNSIMLRESAVGFSSNFTAEVVETEDNIVCRSIYAKCGFAKNKADARKFDRGILDIQAASPHITIFC